MSNKELCSQLREIGWSLWDPIGLRPRNAEEEKQFHHFYDEYDTNLMAAFDMFRNGSELSKVANYLYDIEVSHMGLGISESAKERAKQVATSVEKIAERKQTLAIKTDCS